MEAKAYGEETTDPSILVSLNQITGELGPKYLFTIIKRRGFTMGLLKTQLPDQIIMWLTMLFLK